MTSSVSVIKILLLYIVLVGGGLWHLLDKFNYLMDLLASPVIIILGSWLLIENAYHFRVNAGPSLKNLIFWSLTVIVLSIFLEGFGVTTGIIFGDYQYGANLPPYISGVPLSIGFAWLTMLFASGSLMQFVVSENSWKKAVPGSLLIALFMMIFDIFMEPAAIKLGYWNWDSGKVPVQNYLAWFTAGFFFAYFGYIFKIFSNRLSAIGIHVYSAQILYFLMVYFS